MQDAALVSMRDGVRNLHSVLEALRERQAPHRNERVQGLALDEFHGDEGLIALLADLEDRADVGMIQRGGGARLA